jgi:hypothetical protein
VSTTQNGSPKNAAQRRMAFLWVGALLRRIAPGITWLADATLPSILVSLGTYDTGRPRP